VFPKKGLHMSSRESDAFPKEGPSQTPICSAQQHASGTTSTPRLTHIVIKWISVNSGRREGVVWES